MNTIDACDTQTAIEPIPHRIIDAELAADLARMHTTAERSTAEAVGCDCARLRLEVAQLRRTEALLREADDRQRLAIAEQAAAIGALQEKLKSAERQLLVLRAEEVLWRVALTSTEQERDEARRELEDLRARAQPLCGSAGCTTRLPTLTHVVDPEARRALDTILEEVPP